MGIVMVSIVLLAYLYDIFVAEHNASTAVLKHEKESDSIQQEAEEFNYSDGSVRSYQFTDAVTAEDDCWRISSLSDTTLYYCIGITGIGSGFGNIRITMTFSDGSVVTKIFYPTRLTLTHKLFVSKEGGLPVSMTLSTESVSVKQTDYYDFSNGNPIEKLSENTILSSTNSFVEIYDANGFVLNTLAVKNGEKYIVDSSATDYSLIEVDE